jgi:formiminotetrahydrofolate cyclodeaminase
VSHREGPSFGDATVRSFIERLASAEPVPGGGSASAIAAGLGAALVAMVASLSLDRPRYARHEALHRELVSRGRTLADDLIRLADEDADAYAGFAEALKMPKEGEVAAAARSAAKQQAARRAAEVPLETVEVCREVVSAAEALAGRSNRNASSDLNVAALLATAAARGAAANVIVNLPSLDPSDEFVGDAERRVATLLADIERLAARTRAVVESGEERDPVGPPQSPVTSGERR